MDREIEEDVPETPIRPAFWPWTQTGVNLWLHVHVYLCIVSIFLRVVVRYSLLLVIPCGTYNDTLPL